MIDDNEGGEGGEGSTENEVELYMMMCVRQEHFYSVHVQLRTTYAERVCGWREGWGFWQ